MTMTQNGKLAIDDNDKPVMGGTSSSDNATIINSAFDPITRRLLTDASGGGSGTVTSVSVVSANGFAGSVADATTTPAITLSTTVTGILSGNGTAISAASTTGSGSVVLATAPTFPTSITVGAAAGATGDILFKGTTSGTVTLTVADVAGTWTLQLPATDGDSGQVLTTNGSGVTTWETPAGGGNVSNTGTPLNNQIAVWTDATTIEGDADLTFDTATNTLSTGILNSSTLTASEIVITDGSKNLVSAAVATYPSLTELTYLKGVTSAIQTQLNAKGVGSVTSVSFTGGLISVATATSTPALTVAGTSGGIPYFNSASTWATSAALAANALVIGGGAGVAPATTTTGTGVLTALGINVGSAGAFVTFNGALGTPSSGTVTNLTGTASININGTVGATTPTTGVFTTATANSFIPNLSTIPSNGMYLPAANTLGWAINSAAEMQLTSTALSPISDDGLALGTTALGWQSLFMDTGATINIENGNWLATHTSGILTVGTGDLRVTNNFTDATSVVTVGGAQTLTNKTLTSPTINTANIGGITQLAEGASLALDAALSADGTYSGITIAGTAGATLAFGDLVYLASADSRWELADADAATTSDRMLGMCVLAAASDGSATRLLLVGNIRADAAFPAMTIGSAMYVGETAGDIQVAIPTGADNVIRRVGYALTADELYFNPSMDSQATVA